MCVIIYKPSELANIPVDILEDCFWHNPDGAGFAYPYNGKVYSQKGFFDIKSLCLALAEVPPDVELIVHMRIATQGEVNVANCHPFPVTSDEKLIRKARYEGRLPVLVHNGILTSLDDETKERSDTWIFVRDLLSEATHTTPILDWVAQESGSKFAYVHREGVTRHGRWTPYQGMLFSNLHWDTRVYTKSMTTANGTLWTICSDCHASYRDAELLQCDYCQELVCNACAMYDTANKFLLCQVCSKTWLSDDGSVYEWEKYADYDPALATYNEALERGVFDTETPDTPRRIATKSVATVCPAEGCRNEACVECAMCNQQFCMLCAPRFRGEPLCYECETEYYAVVKSNASISGYKPSEIAAALREVTLMD